MDTSEIQMIVQSSTSALTTCLIMSHVTADWCTTQKQKYVTGLIWFQVD